GYMADLIVERRGSPPCPSAAPSTELDAERRLRGKKVTGCRANRQRKNRRIKRDAEGKIDQRIPRRIGLEFSQRKLVPQDCAHVEARAAEHLRASLLGCRDRPVRRATR